MSKERHYNEVELRDKRYDQVIHLVSAAKGAVEFYTCDGHGTRSEGIDLACHLDDMVAQVRETEHKSSGVKPRHLKICRLSDFSI